MDYKHTLDYVANRIPETPVPDGVRRCEEPLLCIPRDLAMHWGPMYKNNHYSEWHYFSCIGKNQDGEECTLFWAPTRFTGWCEKLGRPANYTCFNWSNTKTGEYYKNLSLYFDPLQSSGNITDPDNFEFTYAMGDPNGEKPWFNSHYDHNYMTWHLQGGSKTEDENCDAFLLDAKLKVVAPGYVPGAYGGYELGGYDPNGRFNPATLYGISYYIIAPRIEVDAKVVVGGKEQHFIGYGSFEDQYGNFMTADNDFTHYIWGYCRMKNDGDFFTFRQSYLRGERFKTPKREINRYLYLSKNGGCDYRFGDSFSLEQVGGWTSAGSGLEYPIHCILHTPKGDIWMSPKGNPEHELILQTGEGPKSIYEAPYEFRIGGFDGEVIGEGFVEMNCHEGYTPNTLFTSLENQPNMPYIQPGW